MSPYIPQGPGQHMLAAPHPPHAYTPTRTKSCSGRPEATAHFFLSTAANLTPANRHILRGLAPHGGPGQPCGPRCCPGPAIDPPREVDNRADQAAATIDMRNILLDVRGRDKFAATGGFRRNEIFNARVLLVEDNEINRDVTTMALEILGRDRGCGRQRFAGRGKNHRVHYDLVFMDCQMPSWTAIRPRPKFGNGNNSTVRNPCAHRGADPTTP
jgi:CheY-like chemotaxis protein